MGNKMKLFLLNIKSTVRYFWHAFCCKIGMDIKNKHNKTVEEIRKDIAEYMQNEEDRNFIPSVNEFFLKYKYGSRDHFPALMDAEVQNDLYKIKLQEKVMVTHYAMFLDPVYVDKNGVSHKLNKKELSKRFTKILKEK